MHFIAGVKRPEDALAICHVDQSARLQSVAREDNPKYYELIEAFAELTGVPMLLNTSMNTNGEPLVETPDEALRFFENTEVDELVVNAQGYWK